MSNSTETLHKPTLLKDYTPPAFNVHSIDLTFHLGEDLTIVKSLMKITKKNPGDNVPLVLNGNNLELQSIHCNQQILNDYHIDSEAGLLTIPSIPDEFHLEILTHIKPQLNTSLEGLYKVKNLFCTQCEAQGFRKITYYFDRPDVMTKFTTTIIADKTKYPVLLSNGNLIESKNLENQLHLAKWEDPFKKPCYLFALVAGDLACIEDEFITRSHRKIQIKLYVDHGDEDKTAHALQSVKKAMKWDEDIYGREYDLDIFMIVSTHDFNMGAMENKGLNIFNSKYILANPKTATDDDYIAIERVIGHEYFHNWTGNRITCRDWFQLSLKESLTVFRDAQFSADMTSPAVVRINDANTLRSIQFPQDAGPMAHPVQPKSYIEINNFYTVTIYEKGAEIIHMLMTLLGKENFRKGMDLYFERHDGQAVRIEEFIQAHADANHKDLSQFMQWYHEAGTPILKIFTEYDSDKKQYILKIQQKHPSQKPFQLPFKIGLINSVGKDILSKTLELKKNEENFVFENIVEKPIISLLRDFSAPVKIDYYYTDKELAFLLAHDSDPFARWDAGQTLETHFIHYLINNPSNNSNFEILFKAFKYILDDHECDPALSALLLMLPNENYLIEQTDCTPPHILDKLFSAKKYLRFQCAVTLQDQFLKCYETNHSINKIENRALKNRCLYYLSLLLETSDANDPSILKKRETIRKIIFDQFYQAQNMTDQLAALSVICNITVHTQDKTTPYNEEKSSLYLERQKALIYFYRHFEKQPLVIDKWFSLQARSEIPEVLNHVQDLLEHPAFSYKNPNKVRALITAFTQNLPAFHAIDGSGYTFLTHQIILLNKINPMIAARLCEPLTRWKKYDATRQNLIKSCLEKIKSTPELAIDIYEIVTKSLN